MRVGALALVMMVSGVAYAGAPQCDQLREQAIAARGACGPDSKEACQQHRELAARYKQCVIDASREQARLQEQRESDVAKASQEKAVQEIAARQHTEADEETAHAARINAVKSDPKKMAIAFGASLCYAKRIRTESMAEIAKEKKYGAIGGVVNKDKLYRLQQRIRWADEAESTYKSKLKLWHGLTAAPCSDATVAAAVTCKFEGDCVGIYSEFIDDAPGADER